jgi:hypothetical protein
MKPLLLLLLALTWSPSLGEPWWNKEWKYRRPIAIRNRGDKPFAKGFTMQIEADPDYLQVRDKSKAGLEDWALVRRGERLPLLLQPSAEKTVRLCFRSAAEIPAGGSDAYYLYYGCPDAAPLRTSPDEVFELWEDFSRPEALAERFQVDKDLTVTVADGALVIREVANDHTASSPARLAFRKFPPLDGFELSLDLELDSSVASGAAVAVTVALQEPEANDPSLAKTVDGLIEKLGDDRWDQREKATKDLIALGRPAAARILEAARSTDAEVKWRASHILRMIQDKHPAPTFSAGVATGQPGITAVLTSVIGANRTARRHTGGWPVRTRVVLQRDPEGEVKVLWNGRYPQSGLMSGPVRDVAFTVHKAGGAALGTIKIDNIVLRRFIDEESRPTSTIDVEEMRP